MSCLLPFCLLQYICGFPGLFHKYWLLLWPAFCPCLGLFSRPTVMFCRCGSHVSTTNCFLLFCMEQPHGTLSLVGIRTPIISPVPFSFLLLHANIYHLATCLYLRLAVPLCRGAKIKYKDSPSKNWMQWTSTPTCATM